MIEPSQELLIGYLLQALEPDEHARVAEELRKSPDLRRKCAVLKKSLELPEADAEECDPPPGLANKTCALVRCVAGLQAASRQFASFLPELACPSATEKPAEQATDHRPGEIAALSNPTGAVLPTISTALTAGPADDASVEPATTEDSAGLGALRFRRSRALDAVVACAVLVMIGGTMAPQLLQSQSQAMRRSCQNNQQLMYASLARYAAAHHGRIPTAAKSGKLAFAGVGGSTMWQQGYITDPRTTLCPESPAARQPGFRIATLDEIQKAEGIELAELQKQAGGSFNYTLGYYENGVYREVRLLGRKSYAILSDAPLEGGESAQNHGEFGQNITFEDGHYEFLCECRDSGCLDEFFKNDHGLRKAGVHRNDSVLVGSQISP
ncbi:MAG: hypothetical protein QM811_03090 [Pirellulales bacterium]